jgi:hypothetical protein
MKIVTIDELIISTALKSLNETSSLFGVLEPHGQITVMGGSKKEKGQYIKAKWMIPHEVINEKKKENIVVINSSFIFPMARIPTVFLSDKGLELKDQAEKIFSEQIKRSPRLEAAIKELKDALVEEMKKGDNND